MMKVNGSLSEGRIIEALRKHNDPFFIVPVTRPLRKAAVLIPLVKITGVWHILFTRRTDTVQDHKGQVSFPGGGLEAGDPDLQTTALREAQEEIGLKPNDVKVLGCLPVVPTLSDFLVTPVVGVIRNWPVELVLSAGEVSRVFTIPIEWLIEPSHHREERVWLRETWVEGVVYFDHYDGELLWGITARITLEFLRILGLLPGSTRATWAETPIP